MQARIPVIASTLIADTGNSANTAVVRDTDGSINVGQANVANVKNSGGLVNGVKNISVAATLDGSATCVTCDATAAAFALTLPPAATQAGQTYFIVKKDAVAHTITLTGNAGENIVSSGAVATTFAITTQGQQVVIWSDGTQWYAK